MDFYYGKSSGNSARVAFALHELGLEYVPHVLDVPQGESRTADYLALNPMGKVPVLVDGALELWESNAINWYLAEKYPEAGLLPTTEAGRASAQRWLFFQTAHVSPACFAVFRSTNPRMQKFWGFKPDAQATEQGRKELARFLPIMEAGLGERSWLEGDFTIADIAYAPHLWLLAEGGFDFTATPHVRDWITRLLARPAWHKTVSVIFGD